MSDLNGGAKGKLRESISALVDGEADELELRRVLASVDSQDVRDTWRGYHLQRDMLAGIDMQFAQVDISQNVLAALADEHLPAVATAGRWWRPLASMAVAASVATVVVIGARSFNSSRNTGSDSAAVAQAAVNANALYSPLSQPVASPLGGVRAGAQLSDMVLPPTARPLTLDPNQFAQQRLQQYLLRHEERASLNNGQGVINFAKVSELSNAQ